jgi:hypothetical protein
MGQAGTVRALPGNRAQRIQAGRVNIPAEADFTVRPERPEAVRAADFTVAEPPLEAARTRAAAHPEANNV